MQKMDNRLSDAAMQKYKTMYDLYREIDEDGDGLIQYDEFHNGLIRLGFLVNKRDTATLYHMIDRDSSRTIDYAEFTTLLNPNMNQFTEGRLKLHANVRLDPLVSEFKVEQNYPLPEVSLQQRDYLRDRVQGKVAVRSKNPEVASQLYAAFKFVDPRKDGFITYDEFRAAIGLGSDGVPGLNIGLDEKEVEELISMCDVDRDGCISLTEFVRELTRAPQRGGNMEGLDLITLSRKEYEQHMAKKSLPASMKDIKEEHALKKTIAAANGHSLKNNKPATEEEVVARTLSMLKQKNRARGGLKKAFQAYDIDRSGTVEPAEFAEILDRFNVNLNDNEFKMLWHKFDKDNDGVVLADEFCDAVFRDEQVPATALHNSSLKKYKKTSGSHPNKTTEKGRIKKVRSRKKKQGLRNLLEEDALAAADNTVAQSKSHRPQSTGYLFDPLEWSKTLGNEELGSTFTRGRPETSADALTKGKPASSRSMVELLQKRETKLNTMYANGMRPKTAGMAHTKRLMHSLRPKGHVPHRREHSKVYGQHTDLMTTLPNYQFQSNKDRFLTTSNTGNSAVQHNTRDRRHRHNRNNAANQTRKNRRNRRASGDEFIQEYQANDHRKRLDQTIRFEKGQEHLKNMKDLKTVTNKLNDYQNRNKLRCGARAKLNYVNYVIRKELRGPCRRPGKRLTHHTMFPGTVKHHRPSPHPW